MKIPTIYSAFTLVELMVTVTIIGILTMVGSLSYLSYTSSTRDANRIAQLSNIHEALRTSYIGKRLPLPESPVVLTASGSEIGQQGFLGQEILDGTNYNDGGRDPKTGEYFTYLVTANRKYFQLLANLEGQDYLQATLSQSYAAQSDISYPKVKGESLGVLVTEDDATPIERANLGSSLELCDGSLTQVLRSYLDERNYVSGTGSKFCTLKQVIADAGQFWRVENNQLRNSKMSRYPGCDTDDIILGNGQIWAACNVGATTAYVQGGDTGIRTNVFGEYYYERNSSVGGYFQWGRNDDISVGSYSITRAPAGTSANGVGHNQFIIGSIYPCNPSGWGNNYNWIDDCNGNLWGGGGTVSGSGYYTDLSISNKALMQGPCSTGYHIPTQAEWYSAIQFINPAINNTSNNQPDTVGIASILKLQKSGFTRIGNDGSNAGKWWPGQAGFWTSTPASINGPGSAYAVTFSSNSQINIQSGYMRANALNIRCIKN